MLRTWIQRVTVVAAIAFAPTGVPAFAAEKDIDRVIPRKKAMPKPAVVTPKTPTGGKGLKPGKVFKDCAKCPQMVVLPGGSFVMGSPPGEERRTTYENPQRRVRIRTFAIGRFEVTFAEWDACVSAGGCTHRPGDRGWGRGRRPVMNVSWHDAQQFVRWLSRVTGKRYRLPSEAEWEYAARAGTRTAYPWGTRASHTYANYGKDECCGGHAAGRDRWIHTAPVGSFPPNRFGLYDMQGNVWEWVEDCWHRTYRGAPVTGRAWLSGGNCRERVYRGGSWDRYPQVLRSAYRFKYLAGWRSGGEIGFRVSRTLP